MQLHIQAFLDSLQYMWKGMLGIFLTIGIIILMTLLIQALGKKRAQKL